MAVIISTPLVWRYPCNSHRSRPRLPPTATKPYTSSSRQVFRQASNPARPKCTGTPLIGDDCAESLSKRAASRYPEASMNSARTFAWPAAPQKMIVLSMAIRVARVAVRDDPRIRFRPLDCKRRIIPAQPHVGWLMEEFRHLIKHFGVIFQGLETVSKAFSDVEHSAILFGEFCCHPPLKRGRLRT